MRVEPESVRFPPGACWIAAGTVSRRTSADGAARLLQRAAVQLQGRVGPALARSTGVQQNRLGQQLSCECPQKCGFSRFEAEPILYISKSQGMLSPLVQR